ncbi:MAG TPA: phage tail tube protein [Bryobacteraceae bacterium]|nr:phage tail tube protein [Bryobacteraceae bacterium]
MSYILSNANRWYCAQEAGYGQVGAITAANRIPAVSMKVQNQRDRSVRRDKTGTRTWAGLPAAMRRHTSFEATSYMRDWADTTTLPPHGPMIEASMGAAGLLWPGATTSTGSTQSAIYFVSEHGLAVGQAIVYNGEIRFVAAVITPQVVIVNAPFATAPPAGIPLSATATYTLSTQLPSISFFDYHDPADSVQRVLSGVGVDRFTISMNGDFHQMVFRGMAQDVVDSASFQSGQGGMTVFPQEPAPEAVDYGLIPGNLGQVWMGVTPNQMFTVTQASVEVRNNLALREKEYGSILPLALVPGARDVLMSLEFFAQDDFATNALYQAARQQSPVGVMFQMGQTTGQLMGVYFRSVIPDVPAFDDSETRLKWRFNGTRAQGITDDEMVVAFG